MVQLLRHLLAAALTTPVAWSLKAAVPEPPSAGRTGNFSAEPAHANRVARTAANGTTSTQLLNSMDDDLLRNPLQDPYESALGKKQQADMKMKALVSSIMSGIHSPTVADLWKSWQNRNSDKLYLTLSAKQKSPLRTLVVTSVPDTSDSAELWRRNVNRLRENKAGDNFSFVLFHYDNSNTKFVSQPWYSDPTVTVMRRMAIGCKAYFWHQVDKDLAAQYDYIWLMDGDLSLAPFSWDLYRAVLAKLQPKVSQPAVIPRGPRLRSTDYQSLRGKVSFIDGIFEVMRRNVHSEIQTPVLDARIWPSLLKRLDRSNLGTAWYLDNWWDLFANLDHKLCGGPGILVMNGSPVMHIDTKTMTHTKGHCVRNPGGNTPNRHPISPEEKDLLTKALCPEAAESVGQYLNRRGSDFSAVSNAAKPSHLKAWTMETFLSPSPSLAAS